MLETMEHRVELASVTKLPVVMNGMPRRRPRVTPPNPRNLSGIFLGLVGSLLFYYSNYFFDNIMIPISLYI